MHKSDLFRIIFVVFIRFDQLSARGEENALTTTWSPLKVKWLQVTIRLLSFVRNNQWKLSETLRIFLMMRSPWTTNIFTIYPTFAHRWQSATFPRAKPDSFRMSRFGILAMTRAPISAKTRCHTNFHSRQLFACVINDVLLSLVWPCREYEEATSSFIVAWNAFSLVYSM